MDYSFKKPVPSPFELAFYITIELQRFQHNPYISNTFYEAHTDALQVDMENQKALYQS